MTLREIKDQYAQDNWGYMKWDTAVFHYKVDIIDEDLNEVARLFAKAKLEEAAERAMVDEYNLFSGDIDTSDTHFGEDHRYTVNKESITKTPL